MRPRLKRSESQSQDRDRSQKIIETKTKVVKTIKYETSKFGLRLISENLTRPRLIETEKFYRCRDRDSSRLGNFIDVETKPYQDWEMLRLSRPRPIKTGQKMSTRHFWDWDFIESLADLRKCVEELFRKYNICSKNKLTPFSKPNDEKGKLTH